MAKKKKKTGKLADRQRSQDAAAAALGLPAKKSIKSQSRGALAETGAAAIPVPNVSSISGPPDAKEGSAQKPSTKSKWFRFGIKGKSAGEMADEVEYEHSKKAARKRK